jgi:orotate phosphoribosyltransferase
MGNSTASREQLGKEIISGLYQERMILTWYRDKPEGWILASGLWSPFYVNLRLISSAKNSELYRKAGRAIGMMLDDIGFVPDGKHRIIGLAMAGIPLANAVTLQSGIPSLYTRKLPEDVKTPEKLDEYISAHGQHALVEGDIESGDRLAIIDDLVTKFDSKLLAKSQIEQEIKRRALTDVTVKDFIVLVDREQGGAERAKALGLNLYSFIPFASKGLDWLKGDLADIEYNTITDYLKNPAKYQDKELQKSLKEMAKK